MKTHAYIDHRSLALAKAIVEKVDRGHAAQAIQHARDVNRRWREQAPSPLHDEWAAILNRDWESVRRALLDESASGVQRRQNNPFCRALTPRERWAIYRRVQPHDT